MNQNGKIYLVMGVSGSGKTTIGQLLASQLGIDFFDGDDFHSATNIEKMKSGQPLDDHDRYDWLQNIHAIANKTLATNASAVIACSALKKQYRDIISKNIEESIFWIYLHGSKDLIQKRMAERKDHYMPVTLLQSQFDILEIPNESIKIDISLDPQTMVNTILQETNKSTLGIVGLGVMGKSLARNWARAGVKLSLYNRFVKGVEEQVAEKTIQAYPELENASGFEDLRSFVHSLVKPRIIFMMIKAGKETDVFINEILPHLDAGDILIDGGNSHYEDTKNRIVRLEKQQIHFMGTGVSGGEKGALYGPSIMPSGSFEAYQKIEHLLFAIAAKDKNGNPCSAYIGPEGSGHFVKMIHNGIEYAEMQLIAETYAYLRYVQGLEPSSIAQVFDEWNQGALHSYLLESTVHILQKKEGDTYLIDLILDVAGNKGTGNWATITASELGIPAGMITSALFARYVSTLKESVRNLRQASIKNIHSTQLSIDTLKTAYTAARIINHQQGFLILRTASMEYNWNLDLSNIARIWTNGCIIRSTLMEKMILAFHEHHDVFEYHDFKNEIILSKPELKSFCISALEFDLPIPCYTASLDYLNSLSGLYATANIIQAQRDFFGAHTYQKKNDTTGAFYHTEW
ncbi:MAG: NADP-dependent phosphogluconate dehydrogenase [Sediminibacterium sp.]|jgi:6-phosphogluconate dehydrogenase|uniref:NADP-dependent phosphogluconate dehydrogenase n=1 Tax=unclassified Sediminibacterium TaxID=2635961 RepID=UPI001D8EC1CC|nr:MULTISPECIES: NADP-dependent phosphogluconate dehydrogenase [unclassified Sediminibacterium]MBW0163161.1 NADP-dependent phosphogluconate dehydrogenase [Sediminibacterium sp.]